MKKELTTKYKKKNNTGKVKAANRISSNRL